MATDLGKVGMRMRGDWDSSIAYEVLDAVSYNNGLYIAKQAVPANTTPTNTTYWQPAIVPTTLYDVLTRRTRADIAGARPTEEELGALTLSNGGQIVDFYNTSNNYYSSSMFYAQVNAAYGAGILVSFYGGIYYVKNNNRTWTITNIHS